MSIKSRHAEVHGGIPERRRLLRILGVAFGIAVVIGNTIGVGILRTPGEVAAELRNVWLILGLWVAGGLFALFGTMSVAELATMFPQAGGFYVYARRTFGDGIGFTVGWSDWLGNCAAISYVGITIGEYSAALKPALSGHVTAIGVVIIVLVALLQWTGLRASSQIQEWTSLLKALSFLALIGTCFWFGGQGSTATVSRSTLQAPATISALFVAVVLALESVIVTYDGWYSAIYFAEEVRNPGRSLPRAMISGVLLVIGIYLLVNFALLRVIPLPELAASKLPVADAIGQWFGPRSGEIITAIALITLLPTINAVILIATRILFALSRDGMFYVGAATVNLRGTPTVALFASVALSVLLVASGTFQTLIAMAGFFYVFNYCSAFVALLVLRKREPSVPRPFRTSGYPWTTLSLLAVGIGFLTGEAVSDLRNSLYAAVLIAISHPVYRLIRRRTTTS